MGKVYALINEFFKYASNNLLEYLHKLFNKLFDIGYFPDIWTKGYIVPIFKKGSRDDPGNYRGITLLSTLGKLFSKVKNNRLTCWAENYNVYVEAQAGFRQKMSTVDNIFVVHGLLQHMLNRNKTY